MIKLKSLLTEGRERSNCWIAPSGRVIPVTDTHDTTARKIFGYLGQPMPKDAVGELFKKGFLRVTYMYDGSLVAHNTKHRPNDKQVSVLKDLAIEGGHSKVEYDNERDKNQILWSEFDVLQELRQSPEDQELEKRIQKAADTQRGVPESAMLRAQDIIRNAHGSNILANALEHVGDLAHRAQKQNAIANVSEKVKMMSRYWSNRAWPLEKEITNEIIENSIYHHIESNPELNAKFERLKQEDRNELVRFLRDMKNDPFVLKNVSHAWEETKRALKMYVDAHREHNKPVTKLGKLGKLAAIALGKLDYEALRYYLLLIQSWLDDYYKADEETQWKMFIDPGD